MIAVQMGAYFIGFRGPAALALPALIAGAIAGFIGSAWFILRRGNRWGGTAVAGLVVVALMFAFCLGYIGLS